jgi:hypothetical protein
VPHQTDRGTEARVTEALRTRLYGPRLVGVLMIVAMLVARCDDFSTYPK